jgi:prolyl-tRNA editing enzyme YbaK/EbsC (Cys-tRNA(Pro) deacylase)
LSGAIDRFARAAGAVGLVPDVRRFPEGTRTAEAAARAIGCDVAQIVKSLVFLADDVPILALTSGKNRVDLTRLAVAAGTGAVRRASPEEARAATGFAVGGTPPFGHATRLRTFLDEDLLVFDEVWAAAGTPDSVFPLSPGELLRASRATVGAFVESQVDGTPRADRRVQ